MSQAHSILGSMRRNVWIAGNAFLFFHVFTTYIGGMGSTTGVSMVPTMPYTYRGPRCILIYSCLHRRGRGIRVGDVIAYTNPVFPRDRGCKRVIGMPGDFVSVITPGRRDADLHSKPEDGDWANVREEVVRVPPGHCWVAGDNLEWSRDSRHFGPLPLALVKSKVLAVVRPSPYNDIKWLGAEYAVEDYKGDEHKWVTP
ncbi:LexA/Signal peptidase [Dothidotthia symphoricarpi CBS 119687]|uniref:Mitochondrial inner membrane protease subunit n=1 Tax=Dothidotthia symphoricarpi CBS 119687 TaxID=1392245 RepID=A0A6A6A6Y8_9PLEO|nr:LexA/Signal peptidase [Dothidotthia symphoricarpi CBS 119687]KAF2126893.1 LexA/Signal peptidase [Dothidotthia symphoricarpi CBS 119687]